MIDAVDAATVPAYVGDEFLRSAYCAAFHDYPLMLVCPLKIVPALEYLLVTSECVGQLRTA
jgi:hypothetical protein